MTLRGKVIVITGGARGIGLAASGYLANQGAAVMILDANEANVQSASSSLSSGGAKAVGFVVDVRDDTAVKAIAKRIEQEIGPVDGLVTCAGITSAAPSESMSREVWRNVLDVNLDGTFYACQAFGSAMLARKKGSIVTVSSVSGLGGQSGRVNYVASKWAVIGLTKTLAIEWAQRGVRVNAIAPGPVNTALYMKLPTAFRESVVNARTPMGRAAEPSELAAAVAFLLSDDAAFITGAVLPIDGGYSSGYSTFASGNDLAM